MPFIPNDESSMKLKPEDFDLKKGVDVNPEDRFVSHKLQDTWAAVLFFFHLAITFVYGIGGILYYNFVVSDSSTVSIPFTTQDIGICGSVMFFSFVIGCFFAVFFYMFTLKKPLLLLKVSFIMYAAVLLAAAGLFLLIAILAGSIFLLILAIIEALFVLIFVVCLFFFRKTFPLTATYLKIAAEVMGQFKGMILTLVLGIVLYGVFCVFWVASFVCSFYYGNPWIYCIGGLWMIFSWFWTTQAITGAIRVCVGGVVGRWYYQDDYSSAQTVIASFKRAIFTSFGSVCFGSLITAILATISATFRILYAINRASRPQNIVQCIIKMFVGCFLLCFYVFFARLTHLVKFFNSYAFTFVAVYGLKFTKAGYATAKLLVTSGLEAIFNHVSINVVVFAETLTIGFISVICSTGILILVEYGTSVTLDTNVWVASEVLSLLLALGVGMISTEIISYSIPALLVCSANEPSRMPQKCPELLQMLRTKFPELLIFREMQV
mmetsp:Transcript_21649/g.27558  ORF Transcript_21649/g.27558 Transcript_21649/m.27558 type:complete len:493 (-) Transcript_21649:40-1518(-)